LWKAALSARPAHLAPKGVYTGLARGDYRIAPGRVAELADAKDLGSFGAILAGSTPVAPTSHFTSAGTKLYVVTDNRKKGYLVSPLVRRV
jgi:hypothetical protein